MAPESGAFPAVPAPAGNPLEPAVATAEIRVSGKCPLPGCGHALSMHNELGYCRSRTTSDRRGECICDGTPSPHRRAGEYRS